jgi:hypothetical protein
MALAFLAVQDSQTAQYVIHLRALHVSVGTTLSVVPAVSAAQSTQTV